MAEGRRPLWLLGHGLAALGVVAARLGTASGPLLLGWAALVALTAILLASARARRPRRMPELGRDGGTLGGLMLGLLWAYGLALFAGRDAAAAPVLMLAGAVMAGTALVAAANPLAGLAFLLLAGAGGMAAALLDGGLLLAAAQLLFTFACAATLMATARTLVRRLLAEQTLDEKDQTISLLLREFEESGSDWLWRTDEARRLIAVGPRLAARFGRAPELLEGQSLVELLAGEGWAEGRVAPAVREFADRLLHREAFRDLILPVTIAGEKRWWSLSAAPRRDSRGTLIGFWGVGSDVTERHRSAERMDRMARFDALTSLANRAHVIEALGEALRVGHQNGRRSTLMLIDLDRFKQINDTLGHPIGDRLLIEVAERLRRLASDEDVCGRLGGDEFAVVVPDASDRDRVEALAETIVTTLSAPYDIDGHRLHIGASVGSATAPRDGRTVETLLRNADLALYRAKDDGRGVHRRYEPQLHAAAENRRRIEAGLREAIERGELRLAYQPIVEADSGELAGFEALLRWSHPELGPISPDVFIPIAEEARLIGRIGDWVMHSAAREAASWPAPIRISVNMAAAQLKDPQLTATIIAALSHSGLAPDRLELEVAEDVVMRGGAAMAAVIDRIRSLGVRLVLADFGTGQQSSILRKGRFSSLKIDRSFVRGVSIGSPESVAMVRAIVTLAKSLGMATVAEGAETRADYDRMQDLGCRRIQGWQVGQPLSAESARRMAQISGSAQAVA
ncbi:putative bifunctional diguanylate cyclase/phosphodiesterase [Sphingomonas morindae]|uniref:EAL domain-containing protein n=1 Tax=Sphingomonas morindae TaxID=1541170 RepID=A0ABY4XBW0_9SPHN|nr:EAL domain-containing protein [Sphingomonas morindae]USI74443.1 EAL domain-containing protein [Sphingomonas morindae]